MASVSKFLPKKQPEAGTVAWLNQMIAASQHGVVSEVTIVTPGLAGELLRRNPDNRNIRQTKAEQYASDMIAGRWAFNGEPIIVSADGHLNDGQHRMQAVIDANITVPMLFVFGVARETRLTIDQGGARTAGDYLGMEGVENANIAAAIARLVIAYEKEDGKRIYGESYLTNSQIRQRVNADPDIIAAAHYANSVYRYTKKLCAPAIIGTAFYLLNDVNPMEARDYLDRVAIGEGLRRGEPAFAVRDALLNLSKGQRAARLEVILRGWVKYRSKQPLKLAKVMGNLPALV